MVGTRHNFSGTHRDGLPLQVTLQVRDSDSIAYGKSRKELALLFVTAGFLVCTTCKRGAVLGHLPVTNAKCSKPCAVCCAAQAVGKEGVASRRLMLHITANTPYTGNLEAFQNLSAAQAAAADDDGAGSDTSAKTAATAAPGRPQRSSATGAAGKGGVRMQPPPKPAAAAAAGGRRLGAHFAADYEGEVTDDMAAELAADLADGNASQHSGSDEQQQPARSSRVHASPRFVPGGDNTASRAAARFGSGPGGSSSRVAPRQPARVPLRGDGGDSWQGSDEGEDDAAAVEHGYADEDDRDGAALLGHAAGAPRGRGGSSAPLHGRMVGHASKQFTEASRWVLMV